MDSGRKSNPGRGVSGTPERYLPEQSAMNTHAAARMQHDNRFHLGPAQHGV
jgi:hypothetical protein